MSTTTTSTLYIYYDLETKKITSCETVFGNIEGIVNNENKKEPILSTQLREFQSRLQNLQLQAEKLRCYTPFQTICEQIKTLSDFFAMQTWDLYQEKEYHVENEDFYIIAKSKKTEFHMINKHGWKSEDDGHCFAKNVFEICVDGVYTEFIPELTNEWKHSTIGDFIYKAFEMNDIYLCNFTSLPPVLVAIIVAYYPNWKKNESIMLLNNEKKLDLTLQINDKSLTDHISDALFDCFKNEFVGFELLPCGKTRQISLKKIFWELESVKSGEEFYLSSFPVHGILAQKPKNANISNLTFCLNVTFEFENDKNYKLEEITQFSKGLYDNVTIECGNWFTLRNKKYVVIGCGVSLIQVGWLIEHYSSMGWVTKW